MKKLYRSALFAGVLAMGVAACGDDVTIIEPEPTPPPPLQVSMSPENQALNVGETAVFAVSVSGGAEGAQASWTCASSNTGVATVATSAAGCTVTAEGAGNASVTATVTKGNQTANAGGQVSVTAPPVATPATISINSVNQGGLPADLEDISGQVDVTLNVDPKDETIQRVVLFVDGVEVASQVFAAPVAGVEAEAAAEAMQQVTLSFRSDFYSLNMASGMGVPRHMNGDRIISAALEVAESEADRPSNTVPVRFNNDDGFHVTTDLTSNASAMDGSGLIWYGGPDFSTDITAYPVLYSGRTFESMTLGFCVGANTALTEGPFTITRTCTGVESAGLLPNITSVVSGEVGPNTGDILNGTARFGLTAHPFPVRVDRVAPQGGAIAIGQVASIGNRENWVNGAYTFATGFTNPADAGVGCSTAGCDRIFNARTGTTVVATDVTSPADLDESPTNTAYNVVAVVQDRLANTATITQSAGAAPNALATFGVDLSVPIINWDETFPASFDADTTTVDVHAGAFASIAEDSISGFADPGQALARDAMEHNLVQVTGNYLQSPTMLNVNPIVGTLPSASPFAAVNAGSFVSTPGQIDAFAVSATATAIEYDIDLSAAVAAGAGYFIYQVRARDKAGNLSDVIGRQVYVNNGEVPTIVQGLQTAIALPYGPGDVIEFQGAYDDAVEIVSMASGINYGATGLNLWGEIMPVPNDGVKFNDVIVRPQFLTVEASLGIRSLAFSADGLTVLVQDDATAVAVSIFNGFADPATAWDVSTGGSLSDAALLPAIEGAPATLWDDLVAELVDTGYTITVESWTPATQTSTGIVQIMGTPSTFDDPFAAVAIVENDGAGNVRIVGLATRTTSGSFPHLDDGLKREFRWTFSVSGVSATSTLHAVGLVANDGLVTNGANADGS